MLSNHWRGFRQVSLRDTSGLTSKSNGQFNQTAIPSFPQMRRTISIQFWSILAVILFQDAIWASPPAALVFQTDFGLKDGAVSAMKGVAFGVSPQIPQYDLTHEIPAFNIWEAAYRLKQTVPFWPAGTVFVNVVDPGVGTERKGVVAKTRNGHFIVTPDNGTLTLLAENPGIESVRLIDTTQHRRPGSEASYTFHGRDIFAYVGAKLASGQITFDQVGRDLGNECVRLAHTPPSLKDGILTGTIAVLDPQYGNVWSDIPKQLFDQLNLKTGAVLQFKIRHDGKLVISGKAPYEDTFGRVEPGKPLIFLNSLLNVAVALNQGNFAAKYKVSSGLGWTIELQVVP